MLEADKDVGDEIDAAYRTKYQRYAYSYVPPVVTEPARSTTLKVVPLSKSL